ncbi:hypothetical protein CUJ83_02850 [Methanocella sp. CWC-04]|uniref:Uncharacterized protein n=1 Tax=Methanooceanicella nereidis TaxID=2052831 RepID=A0AAP2RB56_9EURY|nr:hypothetical protein [Methanocella sp. CWC-04]MCD1293934.1 hypothetical protein [Methanocella sp. CWC-04]
MNYRLAFLFMIIILSVAVCGCDDPFLPRAPFYQYSAEVTGLEDFATENGSATIMLPVPAVYGSPILADGWTSNDRFPYDQERHGTESVGPLNTSYGPMLAVNINMTDYYLSYARVTPIAVSPGQNMSTVPTVVPDRINKSWSFDDISVLSGGSVALLDYSTSEEGRREVAKFLDSPLLPAVKESSGPQDYMSYIYIDENLRPLNENSSLDISIMLRVNLNHNKLNASEEGVRSFEFHTYTIRETIPGNTTGFIPVTVRYTYSTGY